MKRLLITLLAITAGASFGCSDNNDTKKDPSDRPTPSWRCTVGETQACYSGPKGTEGVGICQAGHKDCVDHGNGGEWTECLDEVLPDYDYPCDAKDLARDNDCNGVADTEQDEDKDGLTVCDKFGRRLDCCDNDKQCIVPGMKSGRRSLRSRIRKDCIGDFLDGDCNGVIDDGEDECTKEEIDAAREERCGDGVVQNFENCDDGKENNLGQYGGCNPNCTFAHYCGDGIVNAEAKEKCDEGLGRISKIVDGKIFFVGGGTDTYGHCKSDCSGMSEAGYCGDGEVNGDEECDYGAVDSETGLHIGGDGTYGKCRPDCKWGAFCGDGETNAEDGEKCDDGLGYIVSDGKPAGGGTGAYGNNCMPDCSGRTGWCGDGHIDEGFEDCDTGYEIEEGVFVGGDGAYGGCNADCTFAAYCGDGVIQGTEECDNGTYGNQGFYGGCKADCTRSNYCGDGVVTSPYEECDKGKDENGNSLNVGGYSMERSAQTCTSDCSFGSYCGDGIVDPVGKFSNSAEECDEGSFANNGAYGGCTSNCKLAARCGDGIVDPEGGEECDNGSINALSGYGTCNSVTCTWNARCGDGIVNGSEQCDDGLYKGIDPVDGSTIYVGGTGEHGGCNENCTLAPRCGDGKFDSQYEECDLGADKNGKPNQGCSSNCTIVSGWECTGTSCSVIPCGDGKLGSDELCDESVPVKKGFPAQSTYCKGCYPLAGYVCLGGDPACPAEGNCSEDQPCIPISELYGDGIISAAFEDCDDGNKVSGDGCYNGSVEKGYICPTPGERCVAAACGDGIRAYGEECDDGNTNDGDGCSSRCKREEGFACSVKLNEKSACYTAGGKGRCGDGYIQYGEECDDGNTNDGDGCSSTCQIEDMAKCSYIEESDGIRVRGGICSSANDLCGNGKLDTKDKDYIYAEECDLGTAKNGASGSGCDANCRIVTGYHCNADGTSCKKGKCQDGILDAGEECDDGNHYPNDGCSPSCKHEYMFESYTHDDGEITYSAKCGDGITLWMLPARDSEGRIKCKDGSVLAKGWKKEKCPNGKYVPVEACDDGNMVSGDGCSSQCEIEEAWDCTDWSKAALDKCIDMDITYYDFRAPQSKGTGNGWMTAAGLESIYQMDNTCSKLVTLKCTGFEYNNKCYRTRTCDSGNVYNNKCYERCKSDKPDFSKGYCCKGKNCVSVNPVNYKYENEIPYYTADTSRVGIGYPDFGCKYSGSGCGGMVEDYLDEDGKPVLVSNWNSKKCTLRNTGTAISSHLTCKGTHYWWYRSNPDFNMTFPWTLTMYQDQSDKEKDKYIFDSANPSTTVAGVTCAAKYTNGTTLTKVGDAAQFYPLRYSGFQSTETEKGNTYKYGNFTSELHTYFQYRGGEKLDFTGDDDVWAFINRKLFVDLGGMQSGTSSSNQLKAEQCYDDVKCDKNFDVYEDGIYELHFFQAERCDSGSKYKLTLDGFLKTGKSVCTCKGGICESCGDGKVDTSNGEECDCKDGVCKYASAGDASDPTVGCFAKTCKRSYCGDGYVDTEIGEECDQGDKNGTKNAYCTKKCKIQVCGDGEQGAGEECDRGDDNDDNAYGEGECTKSCTIAPYCGDGIVDSAKDEVCDNGRSNNDDAYGDNSCNTSCQKAHYCGDGVKDSREQCDKGTANNKGGYNGCNSDCTKAAYCGDRVINGDEECDNGAANSESAYGATACLANCKQAPYCGDGSINGAVGREQCDNGSNNSAAAYGKGNCTNKCLNAGYCGDGIRNGDEQCDYGYESNKDGEYGGCSTSCTLNSRCGDGVLNEEYETCDDGKNDGSYNGCTSSCTKAGYCGDGIKNGSEECDYGKNNQDGLYGGCSTKCKLNAFCGDGITNGNEQCDLGKNRNNGEYGGCNANCTKAAFCGDGVLNGTSDHPEQCDHGTANNNGAYGGCNPNCTLASSCGDGIINGSEACDDGTENNKGEYGGCNANCTKAPYCGDGMLNGDKEHPEECDFGLQNDGQYGGCNANCTKAPYCGDGNIDEGHEDCDYAAPDAYQCSPYCRTIVT